MDQRQETLARCLAEMFSQDLEICRDFVSDTWESIESYMTLEGRES